MKLFQPLSATHALGRSPAFVRLWIGQSVSLFGSEITLIALPLTAVLVAHATPTQMGLLVAAQTAPYLLFGLLAGVWVDRVRRRPLLVASDFLRALLLASIPLAAILGFLHIVQLYVVGFGVGTLTVLFETAYQSYLPTIVPPEDLVTGNSLLAASQATAQIAGPSLGGGLVALLTPPLAIAIDALSFVFSGLCIGRIGHSELKPAPPRMGRPALQTIGEGLSIVLRQPLLRDPAVSSALYGLYWGMTSAVYMLFATQTLEIAPVVLGLMIAGGNLGGLLGALLTGRLVRRFGTGKVIVWTALVGSLGACFVPLAMRGDVLTIALLSSARLLDGLSDTIFVINTVSLRQAITPEHLRGRVNASVRMIAESGMPLGALVGGILGQSLGVRPTLLLGALVGLVAVLWLWRSPLRSLRRFTESEPDTLPVPR